MRQFRKEKILTSASGVTSILLTYFTMQLLRYWLSIQSDPFNFHDGWKVNVAWILIFTAFLSFYDRMYRIIFQPSPSRQPDPYTLAQAELNAERALTDKTNHLPLNWHLNTKSPDKASLTTDTSTTDTTSTTPPH